MEGREDVRRSTVFGLFRAFAGVRNFFRLECGRCKEVVLVLQRDALWGTTTGPGLQKFTYVTLKECDCLQTKMCCFSAKFEAHL